MWIVRGVVWEIMRKIAFFFFLMMIEKRMWALSNDTIVVKDQTYSEHKFECLIY
jgi:hypothetical protein